MYNVFFKLKLEFRDMKKLSASFLYLNKRTTQKHSHLYQNETETLKCTEQSFKHLNLKINDFFVVVVFVTFV